MRSLKARNTLKHWMYVPVIAVPVLMMTSPASSEEMTAEVVMTKMTPEQRYVYFAGIIEGLAYARYKTDNAGSGAQKQSAGMNCIYDWYYKNETNRAKIAEAFQKFGTYFPGAIIAALVKKDCGE